MLINSVSAREIFALEPGRSYMKQPDATWGRLVAAEGSEEILKEKMGRLTQMSWADAFTV